MNAFKLTYFITSILPVPVVFAGAAQPKASNGPPPAVLSFEITADYPHDPAAFTQGLEVWGGAHFLESTGQYGKSEIRKVEIKTGKVLASKSLEAGYFGEGAARIGGEIFQLTWQEGQILKWRFEPKMGFMPVGKIPWSGEGWGLTSGRGSLWISNGSSEIMEVDPRNCSIKRKISVTLMGQPQERLNELEWFDGKIFANIWMSGTIVRIDPSTGLIDGLMDIAPLMPKGLSQDAVANGIAWDSVRKKLYVTGKLWPKLFELRLLRR